MHRLTDGPVLLFFFKAAQYAYICGEAELWPLGKSRKNKNEKKWNKYDAMFFQTKNFYAMLSIIVCQNKNAIPFR